MKLKNCPFCDGVAEGYCHARTYDFVECHVCGASQSMYRYKTAEEAAKAWNTRASVTADPRVAELEAAIDEVLGCFNAAFAEGLAERLDEAESGIGTLKDIIERRVLHAMQAALAGSAAQTAGTPPHLVQN